MAQTIIEGHRHPRIITLPATHGAVSIDRYVAGIRTARANPAAEFSHGLCSWWPATGAKIMREFRAGWQDRMQQRVAVQWAAMGKHEWYLWRLREETDRQYRLMLRPALREDANPRLIGEMVDSERRLILWRARKEAQRVLRREGCDGQA